MPQGSQATKEASGRRDLAVTEGQVWVAADGESTSLGKQHVSGMCGARGKSQKHKEYTHVTSKAGWVCGDASQREERGSKLGF